jgi:hypothetical protein
MKADEKPFAVVEFLEKVSKTFPTARVEEDPPKDYQTGAWFIDVYQEGLLVVVEWRRDQGFGLTMIRGSEDFGDGHDHVIPSVDAALALMAEMFGGTYKSPRADAESELIS